MYKISIVNKAKKQLKKLDKKIQLRILNKLDEIAIDPYTKGKRLSANLSDYYSYRVGDYRLIAEIENNELIIIVVKIDHRSVVYKNN